MALNQLDGTISKMNEEDEVHYFEKKSIRKGSHLVLKLLKLSPQDGSSVLK